MPQLADVGERAVLVPQTSSHESPQFPPIFLCCFEHPAILQESVALRRQRLPSACRPVTHFFALADRGKEKLFEAVHGDASSRDRRGHELQSVAFLGALADGAIKSPAAFQTSVFIRFAKQGCNRPAPPSIRKPRVNCSQLCPGSTPLVKISQTDRGPSAKTLKSGR